MVITAAAVTDVHSGGSTRIPFLDKAGCGGTENMPEWNAGEDTAAMPCLILPAFIYSFIRVRLSIRFSQAQIENHCSMRLSQRQEDGRSRQKIKECPKSEVTGKRRKSIVNLSYFEMHEAGFDCCMIFVWH